MIKTEVAEEQNGFIEEKGTWNAILIMGMLAERSTEMQHDLYLCFTGYEKDFDRVDN